MKLMITHEALDNNNDDESHVQFSTIFIFSFRKSPPDVKVFE